MGLAPLLLTEHHVHSWPSTLAQCIPVSSPSSETHDMTNTQFWAAQKQASTQTEYPNKVTFIGAQQSTRLTTQEYTKDIPTWYPNHTLQILKGGHFVQQGPDAAKVAALCVDAVELVQKERRNSRINIH